MCGIFFYQGKYYSIKDLMSIFLKSSHRGPDSCVLKSIETGIIGFHRLAINDMSIHGDQPFYDDNSLLICNGEIYNYKHIQENFNIYTDSLSDCSILLPLYKKVGIKNLPKYLDGDFAIIIVDNHKNQVHLLRDPVGVKPLFYGFSNENELFVASEMKSINSFVKNVIMLDIGSTLSYDIINKSYKINFWWNPIYKLLYLKEDLLVKKLENAVKKRLISDRPLGLFISGGLDSSLVASIACKYLGKDIHSFSIGMIGSPDLMAADKVVDYLGIQNHHSVNFTFEEGLKHIRDVIYHLETFDITTIRASVPQYLLSKYIQEKTNIKVLLSGEGSDELFGGYLYFHKCPSNEEFKTESQKLIRELQYFDVLRADRTTSGCGLEIRVPFLDRGFIKYVLNLDPMYKNPNQGEKIIEKKILRDCFYGYLPNDILYRTKDAFSDACGRSWIPSLQNYFNETISDEEFNLAKEKYTHLPPKSKEAYYYRKVFEEFFPDQSHIVPHFWLPNWNDNKNDEPSAKLLQLID